MRLRTVLLTLSLAGPLAGCAGGPEAFAANSVDQEWTISSKGSRELNFEMQKGGVITYSVNASAEVRYDLHSHAEDGTTTTHEEGRGRTWSGTFTAPADDVYSIFVAGNGSTSVVKVRVDGPFVVKE